MTTAERIKSNFETHGALWTLRWAQRNGINRDTVHFALVGKYRKGGNGCGLR